jgi:phosphopantetheinyl transferase (holo-ACP synthase)
VIGNDVVDLELAAIESNWRRKGFLQKIFSPAEQELITTSKNPDKMVWLLWSMKEAAYKAHQRSFNLHPRLNWRAQECRLVKITSGTASGKVEVEGNTYYTTSEITSAYIYTSAEKTLDSGVKNGIFKASSSEAKEELKRITSAYFKVDMGELQLKKNVHRMPFLEGRDGFFFDQFSLSGHGEYSAYSLSLINCETTVKHS